MIGKHIHIFQHVSFEAAGAIELWVKSRGHFLGLTRFYEQYELPDLEEIDWLIVLGGAMSANDEAQFDWMKPEQKFIERAISKGKTVTGICLGAQMIAKILGAQVFVGNEKEIGWFPVHLIDSSNPLFEDYPTSFTPFHYHSETFDLPSGAKHLAYSAAYPNQAFSYGSNVFGFQFHLEADQVWLQKILEVNRSGLKIARYVQDSKDILAQTQLMEANRINLFKLFDKISLNLQ
jgi:GMP synthase-like glutamine amidotransferase